MNQASPLPPYLHPKWKQQVAIEEEMLALGSSRMQDKINKARDKKDMSNFRPYRSLLTDWVLPVSDEVTAFIKQRRKGGPKHISLPLLKELDPDVCAMVALKTVLRMIANERRAILALAVEIGTSCEHEARAAAWKKDEKAGWRRLKKSYEKRGSNSAHQRRSRVAIFNKYVSEKIGWRDWTEDERIHVGFKLIDCVVKGTGRFRVMGDPEWRPKVIKGRTIGIRPLILAPDEKLIDWLRTAMDDELVHSPAFLPTVMPPKPWIGPRDGGYWTPFVKTPFLIRFHASHEDQKQRAIDEYEALDMPEVYEAINHIQNTAWQINERILEIANKVWDGDLAIAGLPRQDEEFVPPRPPEADHDEAILKAWKREAGAINTKNAKRISKYVTFRRTLVAANRMRKEEEFYFPHMLDFRGRMYPIPVDLQPQGTDLHRGLLTFSNGKPVSNEDAGWLAIQLANVWGFDKESMDDRMAWTEERNDMWRSIAGDPLGDRRWLEGDDPWQVLAAAIEWVRWLDEGEGMISSLPIRVDGTCNGIQHLSAMVLDEVGGEAVNLVPSDKPRDIYQEVADKLTVVLKDLVDEEVAMEWLHATNDKLPRSFTKRPVMILPYGGSKHAYFQYTLEWLQEHDEECILIPYEDRIKAVSFIVPLLWEAVEDTVVRAREVMKWLQDNALNASKDGLPLYWKTPAGFIVRHFYGQRVKKRIRTSIDGQIIYLVKWDVSPKLDPKKQAKGIAPNFVHSMDASALMTCVNIAFINDIQSMTTIHDAYGTVASDMWKLTGCIRSAFVETYKDPVLKNFQLACQEVTIHKSNLAWPSLPNMGNLVLAEIVDSTYFFS